MNISELLIDARGIWGPEKMSLSQIIVRLGVDLGKLCRYERNADKDRASHTEEEIKREMGNILFSVIRWTDDLGFDPEECLKMAMEGQRKFAEGNKQR